MKHSLRAFTLVSCLLIAQISLGCPMIKTGMPGLGKQVFTVYKNPETRDTLRVLDRFACLQNIFFKKPSLGLIKGDMYVVLAGQNKLLLNQQEWVGKGRSKIEIVYLDEEGIAKPADFEEAQKLTAVVLTPERVWLLMPAGHLSGFYERGSMSSVP